MYKWHGSAEEKMACRLNWRNRTNGVLHFTTIERLRIKSVKVTVWSRKFCFSDRLYYSDIGLSIVSISTVKSDKLCQYYTEWRL